jgi:hypothetical protein
MMYNKLYNNMFRPFIQQYCAGIKLLRACIVEVSGSTLGRAISIRNMRVCFLGNAKLNRA